MNIFNKNNITKEEQIDNAHMEYQKLLEEKLKLKRSKSPLKVLKRFKLKRKMKNARKIIDKHPQTPEEIRQDIIESKKILDKYNI